MSAENVATPTEELTSSKDILRFASQSAFAALSTAAYTTTQYLKGGLDPQKAIFAAMGVGGFALLAGTMSYIHKKEHGGLFSASKDPDFRSELPTRSSVEAAKDGIASQRTEALAEVEQLKAGVAKNQAVTDNSIEPFEKMFDYAKKGAAALVAFGGYKFLTGSLDGSFFLMSSLGVGGMVAAVHSQVELARRGFLDKGIIPSKEELVSVKADVAAQKADAMSDVQSIASRLEADKPAMKM
jgi:hypothetical protein